MKSTLKVYIFLLFFLISGWARAEGVELLHIENAQSDLRLKIETIRKAQTYIDLISYHHDDTESSRLLMEALRMAALRGVRVRYIYDQVASSKGIGVSDFSDPYWVRLYEAGVRFRKIDLADRLTKWGLFKLIHSKLLIADIHDKQVLITGGRNSGDRYLKWLDATFILRSSCQSTLAQKVSNYFNQIWQSLNQDFDSLYAVYGGRNHSMDRKVLLEKIYNNEKDLLKIVKNNFSSSQSDRDVYFYKNFLKEEETEDASNPPYFILHEDQVEFLNSGMIGQEGDDEITQSLEHILKTSQSVEIATILFYLTEEKEQMLKNYLETRGRLTVLSNSIESFPFVLGDKKGVQAMALAKAQYQQSLRLAAFGKVRLFGLKSQDYIFTHSKYVIGDSAVLITSSNNNYSSDTHGEEVGFYVQDSEFASYMKEYSQNLRHEHYERAALEDSKPQDHQPMTWWEEITAKFLVNFF